MSTQIIKLEFTLDETNTILSGAIMAVFKVTSLYNKFSPGY